MLFDREAADVTLNKIAIDFGGRFHPKGGFLADGTCDYDSYVSLAADGQHSVSIAIRNPKTADAYFAIKRKSAGRNIVEDRLPLADQAAALQYFVAALAIARLTSGAKTFGMIKHDAAITA